MFGKLLVQILHEKRKKENDKIKGTMRQFPVGSLVYIKILQPQMKAKLKPFYHKIPAKVISEYRSIVYVKDFLGRVQRHSKNNIKPATDRSIEFFESLPLKIKMALGGLCNKEKWDEWESTNKLPDYLKDKEVEHFAPITRSHIKGNVPRDHQSLEILNIEEEEEEEISDNEISEEEDLEKSISEDKLIKDLKLLHKENKLINPNLSIEDIPILAKLQEEIDTVKLTPRVEEKKTFIPTKVDNAAVNVDNIISGKRQRKVRFLPEHD